MLIVWRRPPNRARFFSSSLSSHVALNHCISRCTSLAGLEDVCRNASQETFNSVNCATAIYRLGRLSSAATSPATTSDNNSSLFGKLMSVSSTKQFEPQALSNACQGIAMGRLHPSLPPFLLSQLLGTPIGRFKTMDLASVAWSMATLQQQPPNEDNGDMACQWMTSVAEHVFLGEKALLIRATEAGGTPTTRKLPPPLRDLVTLLWSFAKLNHASFSAVFHSLLHHQKRQDSYLLSSASAQDLAMLAWCCTAMAAEAATTGYDAGRQHEGNALAARKMLKLIADHHICRRSASAVTDMNTQDIATLMWSFATVHPTGGSTNRAFDVLERVLLIKKGVTGAGAPYASSPPPQALANIMWSLAEARRENLPLLERTFQALVDRPPEQCTDQDVGNAMWSLAKLRHLPAKGFFAVGGGGGGMDFATFSSQSLVNMLWALAVLVGRGGQGDEFTPPPPIQSEVVRAITSRPLAEYKSAVFTVAWSLACLDLLGDADVARFLCQMDDVNDDVPPQCATSVKDAMQLQQFSLAWSAASTTTASLPGFVRANQASMDALLRKVRVAESSHAHSKIAHSLQSKLPLDMLIVNESSTLPNLFGIAVDMYIPLRKVVIEVDGPSHYTLDGRALLGSTLFKHRLIRQQGYELITIPVNTMPQWIRAQEDSYLDQLARKIVGIPKPSTTATTTASDKTPLPPTSTKKNVMCPVCGKRFIRQTHMTRHLQATHQ